MYKLLKFTFSSYTTCAVLESGPQGQEVTVKGEYFVLMWGLSVMNFATCLFDMW